MITKDHIIKYIKYLSIFSLLFVFLLNITELRKDVYLQIFVYFFLFATAILTLLLRRHVSLGWLILFFVGIYFVLFSTIVQNWSGDQVVTRFGQVSLWIWVLIIFSMVFKTEELGDGLTNCIAWFMLVMSLFMIFSYETQRLEKDFGFVNNSYYALAALPLLMLVKGKKLRAIAIASAIAAILFSLKRTAILALLIVFICYILYNTNFKKLSLKPILLIVMSLFLIIFQDNIVEWFGVDFFSRFKNANFEDGNGRLGVYMKAFDIIKESNVFQLLFGSGYNSLINFYNNDISAHNDFLEILIDYGILGLAFYLVIIIHYVKVCVYHIKQRTNYGFACIASLCVFILVSNFSHCVIYPSYFMFVIIFWTFMEREKNHAIENIQAG